jgi:hypothetical protein
MARSSPAKLLTQLITFIGLVTLIAQFVLIIQNRVVGIPETVLRFFCYFTILTNTLVTITSFYNWRLAKPGMAAFFGRPQTKAAVAVYILVVFIVYNTALRGLLKLTGVQMVVDELLHVIIPVLYLVYWIFFADKTGIRWKDAWSWLLYPFVYLLTVLTLGAVLPSRFYPYPFLDAYNHGYQKVFMSTLIILGLFLLLSFLFIWFSRFANYSKSKSNKAANIT